MHDGDVRGRVKLLLALQVEQTTKGAHSNALTTAKTKTHPNTKQPITTMTTSFSPGQLGLVFSSHEIFCTLIATSSTQPKPICIFESVDLHFAFKDGLPIIVDANKQRNNPIPLTHNLLDDLFCEGGRILCLDTHPQSYSVEVNVILMYFLEKLLNNVKEKFSKNYQYLYHNEPFPFEKMKTTIAVPECFTLKHRLMTVACAQQVGFPCVRICQEFDALLAWHLQDRQKNNRLDITNVQCIVKRKGCESSRWFTVGSSKDSSQIICHEQNSNPIPHFAQFELLTTIEEEETSRGKSTTKINYADFSVGAALFGLIFLERTMGLLPHYQNGQYRMSEHVLQKDNPASGSNPTGELFEFVLGNRSLHLANKKLPFTRLVKGTGKTVTVTSHNHNSIAVFSLPQVSSGSQEVLVRFSWTTENIPRVWVIRNGEECESCSPTLNGDVLADKKNLAELKSNDAKLRPFQEMVHYFDWNERIFCDAFSLVEKSRDKYHKNIFDLVQNTKKDLANAKISMYTHIFTRPKDTQMRRSDNQSPSDGILSEFGRKIQSYNDEMNEIVDNATGRQANSGKGPSKPRQRAGGNQDKSQSYISALLNEHMTIFADFLRVAEQIRNAAKLLNSFYSRYGDGTEKFMSNLLTTEISSDIARITPPAEWKSAVMELNRHFQAINQANGTRFSITVCEQLRNYQPKPQNGRICPSAAQASPRPHHDQRQGAYGVQHGQQQVCSQNNFCGQEPWTQNTSNTLHRSGSQSEHVMRSSQPKPSAQRDQPISSPQVQGQSNSIVQLVVGTIKDFLVGESQPTGSVDNSAQGNIGVPDDQFSHF